MSLDDFFSQELELFLLCANAAATEELVYIDSLG